MAVVTFTSLSEHNAIIKNRNTVIWRIQIDGSIDEYYIEAKHVHSKLGGTYWCDTKHLIKISAVNVPKPFATGFQPEEHGNYLDITCGHCGIINSMNQDTLPQNQGSHYCKSCKGTIAIVIGNRITLRHGSKDGAITKR